MKNWLARIGEYLIRMTGGWQGQSCRHWRRFTNDGIEICDSKRGHVGDHEYRIVQYHRKTRKYILAENRKHAAHWCKISNLRLDVEVTYVSSPRILYGLNGEDCDFIYYETWHNHPNADELDDMIRMIKAKGFHKNYRVEL